MRVAGLEAPAKPLPLSFLSGDFDIPKDFNRMGQAEIEAMFGSGP